MDWKLFFVGLALFVLGILLVPVIGLWAVCWTFPGGLLMGMPVGQVIGQALARKLYP